MPNALQGLLADPRGEMSASPRKNKLIGLLADALQGAQDYAQRPDPRMPGGKANPVLGLLADAASLQSLATTAQRVSYGEPLTNKGKANVPFLKPETADVAMMAPLSPRNALAALGLGMADTGAAKAIFAGIGAKTADKAALAQAEKMAAKGADPKAIWRDTGWFKGGDGKWRFEIDDSGLAVDYGKLDDVPRTAMMGDLPRAHSVIAHDQLYNAYPHVGATWVGKQSEPGASFTNLTNRGPVFKGHVSLSTDRPTQLNSLAGHELQHAVQDIEGFSAGGSPEMAGLADEAKRIYNEALPQFSGTPEQLMQMARMNAYRRLAGEVEARAVQKRLGMTPEQRREVFPLDSYDVPVKSLIYR
jgi:hypothetical protein